MGDANAAIFPRVSKREVNGDSRKASYAVGMVGKALDASIRGVNKENRNAVRREREEEQGRSS